MAVDLHLLWPGLLCQCRGRVEVLLFQRYFGDRIVACRCLLKSRERVRVFDEVERSCLADTSIGIRVE